MLGEVSFCVRTLPNHKRNEARSYLHSKSALTFQVGTDLIIQVGSDSTLLCSVIYKFVTTNAFNCHSNIA